MDELSMVLALMVFSFFTSVTVYLFVYSNYKRNNNYHYIALASGLYTISLFLFFFDARAVLNHNPSMILTFNTFLFLILAVAFIVESLTQIYKIEPIVKMYNYIIVSIIVSAFAAFLTVNNYIFMRNVIFVIAVVCPLFFVFVFQKKAKNVKFLNLISLQVLIIYSVAVIAAILYLILGPGIDFEHPPLIAELYILIVDTLLITIIFSLIVEVNIQNSQELALKNELLESMFSKVKKISEVDALTEIYNRRKISDILQLFYDNYINNGISFSVLILDIDNFKHINDHNGHLVGDEVLKLTAKEISHGLRNTDILGRWGGDEFMIILANSNLAESKIVKQKIKNYNIIYEHSGKKIPIKCSIGCAEMIHFDSIVGLLHEADMKMYEEKESHRQLILKENM